MADQLGGKFPRREEEEDVNKLSFRLADKTHTEINGAQKSSS